VARTAPHTRLRDDARHRDDYGRSENLGGARTHTQVRQRPLQFLETVLKEHFRVKKRS